MRFITADKVFSISEQTIEKPVIVIDKNGTILDVSDEKNIDASQIEYFDGSICPGFVNTHCHLELSYMKSKIANGGGLHHFIKEVENLKKPGDEQIIEAIKNADEEMYRNGIVAVGDISNTANSFAFKRNSKLYYHTFIEIYAFDEARADAAFERGLKLQSELPDNLKSSITPHAPYSASEKLLKLIADYAEKNNSVLSIHMQETSDEDLFFK